MVFKLYLDTWLDSKHEEHLQQLTAAEHNSSQIFGLKVINDTDSQGDEFARLHIDWKKSSYTLGRCVFIKDRHAPSQGARPQFSILFRNLLNVRTRYEKQQPHFLQWTNYMRGNFTESTTLSAMANVFVTRMLTCDLFGLANLLVLVVSHLRQTWDYILVYHLSLGIKKKYTAQFYFSLIQNVVLLTMYS